MGLLDSWWNLVWTGLFAVSVFLYDWMMNRLSYFDRRNIVCVKNDLIDLIKDLLAGRYLEVDVDQIYKEYPDKKYIGYFRGLMPTLLIRDPTLVVDITEKAFNNFHDRWRHGPDEFNDPLCANLFFLCGSKWKHLRNMLGPGFSDNRLQAMFPAMQAAANSTCQLIRKTLQSHQEVDAKELFASYTAAVLAQSSGISLTPESLKDQSGEFRKMMRKFTLNSPFQVFLFRMKLDVGYLWYLLRSTAIDVEEYFVGIFRKEMGRRRGPSGVSKQDFIQLLVELKEKEHSRHPRERDSSKTPLVMNDHLLTSQMILFLQAGAESICSLLCVVCYHLAKHRHHQDRVRKELKLAKQANGVINYLALKDMAFLDQCIAESLRLYPMTEMLTRVCTQNYTLDDGQLIEKGVTIDIPVKSLQRDPNYWIKPDQYDPDRFQRDQQVPGTYLPFGQGPRTCIGQSFTVLQVKLMMAKLMENFELTSTSSDSRETLRPAGCFHHHSAEDIWLRIKPLNLTAPSDN